MITGIKFSLSSVTLSGPVDYIDTKSSTTVHHPAVSAVSLLGRLDIGIRGPRLNSNKVERTSVMYGEDNRLNITVVKPMPRLEVYLMKNFLPSFPPSLLPSFPPFLLSSFPPFLLSSFPPFLLPSFPPFPPFPPFLLPSFISSSPASLPSPPQTKNIHVITVLLLFQVAFRGFPSSLLSGELQAVQVSFSNQGEGPLHKLYVASTSANFFAFVGASEDCEDLTVPEYRNNSQSCSLRRVSKISLPDDLLSPGATAGLTMWVQGRRGQAGPCVEELLFYYESAEPSPSMRYVVSHLFVMWARSSRLMRSSADVK